MYFLRNGSGTPVTTCKSTAQLMYIMTFTHICRKKTAYKSWGLPTYLQPRVYKLLQYWMYNMQHSYLIQSVIYSVGCVDDIVTRLWDTWSRNSILEETGDICPFPITPRLDVGAHAASYSADKKGYFQTVKWQCCAANSSLDLIVRLKNGAWPLPILHAFKNWTGTILSSHVL
jgi:hypothetical protein